MPSQTAPSLESNARLPRAVRERSERIRAMQEAQANPAAAEPTPPGADPAPPAIEPPAPTPPAAEVTPPAPPAPPIDPRESDPGYWRQRFSVTQGMLEKERRERVADAERAQQQLDELREQLRTLQTQSPAQPTEIDLSKYFTPQQIEQYGPEQCRILLDVADRRTREEVQAAMERELKPLREARERETANAARTAQQVFLDALGAAVPDYAEIDAAEGWIEWLKQDDPVTGLQRQKVLDEHVRAMRADRVAGIFNAYKATLARPAPTPPVAPAGRAGPSTPQGAPAPAAGYPSTSEIRDFYKRAALNKVTDKERADFEARMQLNRQAA
jgi:hypothetical protein